MSSVVSHPAREYARSWTALPPMKHRDRGSNPAPSSAESPEGILLTFQIPSIGFPRYAGRLSDFWSDHPQANLGSLLTIGHVNSEHRTKERLTQNEVERIRF